MVLLTACPYTSSVPISEANIPIDARIIGKWVKSTDAEKDKPDYYKIEKNDEQHYDITEYVYNTTDKKYTSTVYVSHISKIDDYIFLNMKTEDSGDYYLYRIDIKDNGFTLFEITDNIDEKFNTSEELSSFIKQNMNLSFFYNKDESEYVKK